MRLLIKIALTLQLAAPLTAGAAERWQAPTLNSVYPLGNGDFVILFDAESQSYCTASQPRRYYHVVVGQNGVNTEGAKQLYAAALLAMTTRLTVTLAFDDSTRYCYVNRLSVQP